MVGRKLVLKGLIAVALSFAVLGMDTQMAFAQGNSTQSDATKLTGTRKQLATIIFSGLAGSILGLSTLSFYGRPQDHLGNIGGGFAVGIIVGTIYTTYQAARAPYEYYQIGDSEKWQPSYVLGKADPVVETRFIPSLKTPKLTYSWTF